MSSASIGSGSHVERRVLHQPVIPVVAPFLHVRPASAAPPRCTTTTCSIDGVSASASSAICFSGTIVAAAVAAVGGDEQPRLRVVDAIAQRLGAEAAEHDAVDGADARAGEHRDRQLGNQRQVDARRDRPCSTPSDLSTLANVDDLRGSRSK